MSWRQSAIPEATTQQMPSWMQSAIPETPQAEQPESTLKSNIRTAAQLPLGYLQGTPYGIATGAWNLLAMGEVLDPEDLDRIEQISEREGVPFDREKYLQEAQKVLQSVPTVSNIARVTEETTGLPLTPKTRFQKFLNFFAEATKLSPKGYTFQGMNVGLPKPVLGAGVAGTSEVLKEAGVPEPFADLASFLTLKPTQPGAPSLEVGPKTKPSGLPSRRYEKLVEPTEVAPGKIEQITRKTESDFRSLSEKILKASPIDRTRTELRINPALKADTTEAMDALEQLALKNPKEISTQDVMNTLVNNVKATKKGTGYAASEYDKDFNKFVVNILKETPKQKITAYDLIKQYRKNNKSIRTEFEPTRSNSYNLAKRDAALEHNRAIADIIEKRYGSEIAEPFKALNKQYSEIMDAEFIDKFLDDLFTGQINFNKARQVFEKQNTSRIFERALGENYPPFKQLLKDLLTSERPYKMLRAAREKGWSDLFNTGFSFILHPTLGKIKAGLHLAKETHKKIFNFLLDKPQFTITYKQAVDDLKAGKFAQAEAGFIKLNEEVKGVKPSEILTPQQPIAAQAPNEPIPGYAERIQPKQAKLAPPSTKALPQPPKALPAPKKLIPWYDQKPITETKYSEAIPNEQPFPLNTQPTLLEYKPTKQPKPPQKKLTKSKELFEKKLSGDKLQPSETNKLLDTKVSLLQTRKGEQKFHGSRTPIKELNPDIYSSSSLTNIYGPGFYVTDALDIADGYSKAKFAQEPIVYSVREKTPQKIFDAEKPIRTFKKMWTDYSKELLKKKIAEGREKPTTTLEDFMNDENSFLYEAMEEGPKNLRELYDNMRDIARGHYIPIHEVQDSFYEVMDILLSKGYQGISHKGGLLTNKPEHKVTIYWEPKNLEIQQYSYPKEFKKARKVARPPELPLGSKELTESQRRLLAPEGKSKELPYPKERADITKKGLSKQKKYLLEHIDDVLANPAKYATETAIDIRVPGDGHFRIKNNPSALEKARKRIVQDWPTGKPPTEAAVKRMTGKV